MQRRHDARQLDDLRASTARRRRLFVVTLVSGLVLGAAGSSRADGMAPFSAAEQQAYCESLSVSRVGPESWDEPVGEYDQADLVLAEIETHLCMARFAVALEKAQAGRRVFADLPDTWQADRRRARLEVLAATAKIARGDRESARLNFHWALEIDPYLELDPAETSPKVLEMFRESRASFVASR